MARLVHNTIASAFPHFRVFKAATGIHLENDFLVSPDRKIHTLLHVILH